jgi:hypothetical protein
VEHSIFYYNKLKIYFCLFDQIIDNNTNGWCYTPLEKVKESLEMTGYPSNKLHYIVGDVLQTLQHPENIPDKIAILRLDTDWYESTKHELNILFPKLKENGVLIIDDYGHWVGAKRAVDEFRDKHNIVNPLIQTDYTEHYWIKNKMNSKNRIKIK